MPRRGRLVKRGHVDPRRTCVGCRERTAKTDLLRLVVVEGSVVPDPRGRLPGRGASLHPDLGCLELAERRRAFPRAFRLAGPLDVTMLRAHLGA
ncbi:MAG TPA: YlxR family protein [Streptosporangiaceae bacterium]|nr:YlxR family protein [Streptosporangiaceae bacterium]